MISETGICKKTGKKQTVSIDYIRADDFEGVIKICTMFSCPIMQRVQCRGRAECSVLDQKGYEH